MKDKKEKLHKINENSHAVRGSPCDLIGPAGAGQQGRKQAAELLVI